MSVARQVIKAIKVKFALNRLARAKENAIREMMGLPIIQPWYQECFIKSLRFLRETLCLAICPCCIYDKNRRLKRRKPKTCCDRLFSNGSYENDVLKQFLGFFGGILIAVTLFSVMLYQMQLRPSTAFYICAVLGLISTFSMAFIKWTRCLVLLMLPQFFTSKGRMFFLMYALYLVMNHPLINFNRNILVMSQSSTCGQEMAYNKTKDLVKAAVAPFAGVVENIRDILDRLQKFAEDLRKTYERLKKTIEEIGAAIQRAAHWVGSMADICNDKIGQPYRRCRQVFDDGENRCKDALVSILHWACDIAGAVGEICNIVRIGELICMIVSAIKDLIVNSLALPVRAVLDDMKNMFYFNVTMDYEFNYTMTQSKSYKQIRQEITREIWSRVKRFMDTINLVQNLMMFSIIFVLLKALFYQYKFLSNDRFDNIYVTYKVRDIDERRKALGREPVLPLTWKEQGKYVYSNSLRLANKEKKKLIIGIVLFVVSAFNAGFYLACDYGLYAILELIRKNFDIETKAVVPPHLKLHVDGKGPFADMYKAITAMFDPIAASNIQIDTAPCLPHAFKPDFSIYIQIGVIYGVCLMLTVSEAYGLRLRHSIMACYYPKRERTRAIWLYNHIIKTRGNFLQNTRRELRRKYFGNKEEKQISLLSQLAARFPLAERILRYFGWNRKACLCCAREGRPDDMLNFIHCINTDCNAVYCLECYSDLNNMCTVCMNPVDYGDDSDMSEEIDSSEDESEVRKRSIQKQAREAKLEQLQHERTDSSMMHRFQGMMGITEFMTKDQQQTPPAAKTKSKSDRSGNNKYNSEECSESDEAERTMNITKNNRRESIKDLLVTEDIFEDTTTDDSDSDSEDIHVNVPLQEPRRCVLCRN